MNKLIFIAALFITQRVEAIEWTRLPGTMQVFADPKYDYGPAGDKAVWTRLKYYGFPDSTAVDVVIPCNKPGTIIFIDTKHKSSHIAIKPGSVGDVMTKAWC